MKDVNPNLFLVLATSLLIGSCSNPKNNADKQSKVHSTASAALHDTIAHLDSVLFEAFNSRDLDKIKAIFSEDLEFYHDLGGVTNYQQNIENFKKSFDGERRVRRELVAGSLEVYPIHNYGAVEIGSHRFYGTEKGQKEKLGSEARFVQVWQRLDSMWKVTRVISYAHNEY